MKACKTSRLVTCHREDVAAWQTTWILVYMNTEPPRCPNVSFLPKVGLQET